MNREEKRRLCQYLGNIFGSDFERQCMEAEVVTICTYNSRGERVPKGGQALYCEALYFGEGED